jgi:hypothetical protein
MIRLHIFLSDCVALVGKKLRTHFLKFQTKLFVAQVSQGVEITHVYYIFQNCD